MINHKFKIILTTRNAEKYIEKSILSLKNQRYTNFQCCIIDDCSEDKSQEIIKKTVDNDNRFLPIFNTERKWGLFNRCFGTNAICTDNEDIIVILDGDDWFSNNTVLEYLNCVYQDTDVWITYGQHYFATESYGSSRFDDVCFTRFNNLSRNLSHLRSYKYWLFKKIKEEDFKDKNGNFFTAAEDVVALYPMCEMAGNKHLKFLPRVSYIYNNLSELNENKVCGVNQIQTYFSVMRKPMYPLIEKNEDFKKLSIKLYDKEFIHCGFSGTDINGSQYIDWYRGNETRDFVFYTTRCIPDVNEQEPGIKVAWLLEPENIDPSSYQYVRENHSKFNYILTHSKSILDVVPNSFFVPAAQTWIKRNDWKIYDKTYTSCFIYSKTYDIKGHDIREEILKKFRTTITKIVGRGIKEFKNKLDVLKEAKYCIIAQNNQQDWYFTEHLIDCFLTGTIPIFYGCPSISSIFNIKGFYTFNTISELDIILKKISLKDYDNKEEFIAENFNTAHQYYLQEDYIYNNFLRNILTGSYPK